MIKRIFDLFLSVTGLFFSFPLWILFSFAIWLKDGRPVFYIQERIGRNGNIFKAIKFRTLGYRGENSNLSRFLRTTALDELPQLINILKGEMSIVGPRPLVPQEVSLDEKIGSRSIIRPGLTGFAQTNVPKDTPLEIKFDYDLWYIKNQSIYLDVMLVLKSFWISFNQRWDAINKCCEKKNSI